MTDYRQKLFSLRDEEYKNFSGKLIPTVDPCRIIGIRTPELRRLASEIFGGGNYKDFLCSLPHKYYEENNLHAFIIEKIRDYDTALRCTEEFLPYIDNWATCDSFIPPVFKKNRERLLPVVKRWISSDSVYTVRYGIGMLMRLYLDGEYFSEDMLALAASVKTDEYYINMMTAWYFATALAKQYDAAIVYFVEKKLPKQVHNRAIQKAIESRRISDDSKAFLRTLKYK